MASPNPARTWALATAGLLTQRNEHDHALLGGGMPSAETSASRLALLERDWNVGNRAALLGALTALARAGDRKVFNDACLLDLQNVRGLQNERGLQGGSAQDDATKRNIEFARKHRARVGSKSLLAWDTGRLVTLAGWGYLADLISEDEAWSFILPMAQATQRAYASWDELGKHYLLGRELATGEWDPPLARAHLAMFDDAQSPWRTLPWGTDLQPHMLTIPFQPIVIEAPPQSAQSAQAGPRVGSGTVKMPSAPNLSPAFNLGSSPALERESASASPKKRSALPFVIGGAALLVVGGVGATFAFGFNAKKPAPAAPIASASAPASPSSSATAPPIPSAAPQPSVVAAPSHAPSRTPAPNRPSPRGPRGVPASPKKH